MEQIAMQTLAKGFDFVENPRWHEGRLWFVDFFQEKVMTMDAQGHGTDVVHVPGRPSGMGWLPDGSLLVVSMTNHQVMRYKDGRLSVHADLDHLVQDDLNDMLVDERGRAYVGNFGCKLFEGGEAPKPTCLVMIDPDGKPKVVAEDLVFPNGMVIIGGGTLVVAESFAMRLTAFDLQKDGTLTSRRVWASLGEYTPDGIALDAKGGIWVSAFVQGAFLRVEEGGAITHQALVAPCRAVACALGGADGRTLYGCVFDGELHDVGQIKGRSRLDAAKVPIGAI